MDFKTFIQAIEQIAEEKGITKEKVIEVIETAIAAAYKKDYGRKGQIIKAKLNPESGEVKFWRVRIVVNEGMLKKEIEEGQEEKEEETEEGKVRFNPEKHIMVDEAKEIKSDLKPGDELEEELESEEDFGRIAAQTAKQVVVQRIGEAEREAVFQDLLTREGQITSGIVQRLEGRNVFLDLGRTTGTLLYPEQIPGEAYRIGQRLKTFVLKVERGTRDPIIFLSRSHPKMITKLFELEVPEIASGAVVMNSIAREPGSRSKIAVSSKEKGIDPIGSCVGQKGTRVLTIINELGGEKIDIIAWSENPEEFIANALSPAKVLETKIDKKENKAVVVVPDDQLSLAIGRAGQNVRLAAKLTGWKIDVRSRAGEEAVSAEPEEKKGKVAKPKKEKDSEEKIKITKKREKITLKKKSEAKKSAQTRQDIIASGGIEAGPPDSQGVGRGEKKSEEKDQEGGVKEEAIEKKSEEKEELGKEETEEEKAV